MNNLTIYITTHKENTIDNEYLHKYSNIVVPINVNNTIWEYPNIFHLNTFMCEFTTFYYVWKNKIYNEYVGFCHYRRLLPINEINNQLNKLNNDYIIFDKTSWFDGVFFPLIEHSTILDVFKKYIKSYDGMYEIYKSKYQVPGRGLFITSYHNFNNMCKFMFGFINSVINDYTVKEFIQFVNLQIQKNINTENAKSWYTKYDYNDINIYRFFAFILEYMCGLYIEYDSRKHNKKIIEHLIDYGK